MELMGFQDDELLYKFLLLARYVPNVAKEEL